MSLFSTFTLNSFKTMKCSYCEDYMSKLTLDAERRKRKEQEEKVVLLHDCPP